ncbi:D-alanyl-D-alanine carboxypeptidase family protein [Paenibacillus sp. Cedars]|uniref:D-alanyl-D-alanine carboxypeptidase family protein n=1 Tax=Paenibacillus sp. Cedars TaxID=1980674 RepID=UPI001161FBA4|nr:D-alanyl-D-alanine carboxypeptidase family protein [Paenibacillus sp. Cedars]AWP28435.1 D-alanyl-D-alanine carboxypeptidase [Paenibacillus sp. Cedars]
MMKMKWKKGKSLLSMLIAVCCLLVTITPVVYADHEKGPANHAQAAALIDVTSGRMLYSKNGDERLRIASLTKIMTAIVAIEHGKLDDRVKISKNAFAKEGSSIFLKLGEEMTLENLLFGLMLRSGNDAATAIAEHVGGTEEGFVMLMNEKAAQLGMTNSHFMNPHGLDHDEHYSSANDMAKLTAYALKNPVFSEIVKTPTKKAPNPNESWDYKWDNKNKMLRFYEGADGVKTGYTKKAFRCLVSSATRNGQQIAAVTLNDGNDWNDHSNMLDYGFAHFPLKKVTEKGQKIQGYTLVTGSSFTYAFAHDEESRLVKRLVLHKATAPDVSFGLRGHIELLLDNVSIGKVPVYEEGSRLPETPDVMQKSRSTSGPLGSLSLWQSAGEVIRHLFRANHN